MCIRDSEGAVHLQRGHLRGEALAEFGHGRGLVFDTGIGICLLYTSDAADERSSVDLGGRRIIKKKKKIKIVAFCTT